MLKNPVKTSLALLSGLMIGIGLASSGVFADKEAPSADLPLTELRAFTDIFARIKSDYVEDVSDKKLLENAIRGMLAGLDPHSSYLDPDEFNELQISTSGEFGGLGIEITLENGFIKVIAPMDDTPAQQAGVQAGDLITRIDGAPVKDLDLNDAIKRMRGKPGTDIELTIMREDSDSPLFFRITRNLIQVQSVKSRFLETDYGYVRITSFQNRTPEALHEALARLNKKKSLQGMVLDLRNNPGGILDAAVGVADAFLDKGVIVYHQGKAKDSNKEYHATSADILEGAPIVVLVNRGSASASEIVAGALQDHGRAIILGTKTFGKGSVQTIQEMRDGSAIKLTTARYFTPKGRSIQAEGIAPDIEVDPLKLRIVADKPRTGFEPVKEADLDRHLDNPSTDKSTAKKNAAAKDEPELIQSDYQLYEALNLLKALSIVNPGSSTKK